MPAAAPSAGAATNVTSESLHAKSNPSKNACRCPRPSNTVYIYSMQLVLARHLNHRLIPLRHGTRGEVVGVLRKAGGYQYIRWLGFVTRDRAKEVGRPVRLEISRIGQDSEVGISWQEVPNGMHVLGCMTHDGVYAVVEPMVRVI